MKKNKQDLSKNTFKDNIALEVISNLFIAYQEQLKAANERLYFLFTILSALLMSYVLKYNFLNNIHFNQFLVNGFYFVAFISSVGGLFLILTELMPKVNHGSISEDSLAFYGSLKNLTPNNYKRVLSDKLSNSEDLAEDLIVQCVYLSKILDNKYKITKIVIILTMISGAFAGILLLLSSLKIY